MLDGQVELLMKIVRDEDAGAPIVAMMPPNLNRRKQRRIDRDYRLIVQGFRDLSEGKVSLLGAN